MNAVSPHRSLPLVGNAQVPTATQPRTVRISLTDRCDLACVYCRPSRSDGVPREAAGGRGLARDGPRAREAGVRRVRITGGEPLLHPRVTELVAFVASLGVEDLALTTNATRSRSSPARCATPGCSASRSRSTRWCRSASGASPAAAGSSGCSPASRRRAPPASTS